MPQIFRRRVPVRRLPGIDFSPGLIGTRMPSPFPLGVRRAVGRFGRGTDVGDIFRAVKTAEQPRRPRRRRRMEPRQTIGIGTPQPTAPLTPVAPGIVTKPPPLSIQEAVAQFGRGTSVGDIAAAVKRQEARRRARQPGTRSIF